jgi:hypothetical protein
MLMVLHAQSIDQGLGRQATHEQEEQIVMVLTLHEVQFSIIVPTRNNWQKETVSSLEKILENNGPHTANRTCDSLQGYSWEVMDNPPYSSDLTPSYFHLTGPLKKHPTGN